MDHARFHLSPAPQRLVRHDGAGMRRTWADDLLPRDVARTLETGSEAVRSRFGLALETTGLDDFARSVGERVPEDFDRAEGYRLELSEGLVRIGADTPAARFYACQTAAQMLCTLPDRAQPVYRVEDWPDVKLRGFNVCYHVVEPWMPMLAPDFSNLCTLVEDFSHLKMNALLIEFEGMFPYARHPKVANRDAFTPAQIARLRDLCAERHVQVIPLVQSLGHAYGVLRHVEYAHLRELPRTTQQYCPMNEDARRLFAELADEVIEAFHPTWFHIGGDESRRLNQCPTCKEKVRSLPSDEIGIAALYADHVNAVSRGLLARGVRPIVWGDICEENTKVLDRIDPEVAILFWNYDMVDWRPYVLEAFLRPGRTVFAGPASFFARQSDHMFLYKKAMRNNSLMASECRRNGLPGVMVTNWTKLTPVEAGLVATAFGAHLAWSAHHDQTAFVEDFSRIYFGTAIPRMDEYYQLLSETTVRKSKIHNLFWSAPYNELGEGFMPDWLDRYDWSGKDFSVLLKHHTEQEVAERSEQQMRMSMNDASTARAILDEAAPRVTGHLDLFDLFGFLADSQHLKCRMGLAIGEAVRLLKYPLPDETAARRAAAAELRGTLVEWAQTKARAGALLPRFALQAPLPLHMEFRFDPDAVRYMEGFAAMLDGDLQLQALVTMKPYAPEDL
jgi:hypothetical protein